MYYVFTNIALIRYALKVKKDPTVSPMYDLDKDNELNKGGRSESFGTIDLRKILNVIALVVSLVVVGIVHQWAGICRRWLLCLLAGNYCWGLFRDLTAQQFLKLPGRLQETMSAMIIIGLAQSISAIMSDGKIIDTVVHTLAGGLGSVPTILQAPAMLIANTIINVFLTSGSGQAAAVMPIMVPLSDLIGVTRQTAILAFNFGDGFCNYILPTSTALMGIISACNIPYDRWMRFMWKIFILWLIVGTVLLIGAQLIHFGPM